MHHHPQISSDLSPVTSYGGKLPDERNDLDMNRYSARLSGPVKAASILPADSNRMRQDVLYNPQEMAKKNN